MEAQSTHIDREYILAAAVAQSEDILAVKDLKLRVIAANQAYVKYVGHRSQEDVLGKTDSEIFGVPQQAEPIRSYIQDDLRAQKLRKGECIQKTETTIGEDGSLRFILVRKYPIFDAANTLIATGSVSTDISRHIESAEQLKYASQSLVADFSEEVTVKKDSAKEGVKYERALVRQQKLAEIGDMVSFITHQWKQPLNVILCNMDIIEDLEGIPQEPLALLQKCYQITQDQIRFMSQTINDFKNYLSPSEKQVKFFGCETIDFVIRLVEFNLKKHNIDVRIHKHEHFCVLGTMSELQQAILNIINNSVDNFECQKKVHAKIDITFTQDEEHGIITIRDNGGGIPQELLPDKLFDDYVSTKGDKGTGLGLYIAKLIVTKKFGGSIYAYNTDVGASFTITLPRVVCDSLKILK